MPFEERINFIAQGLPIIARSARSLRAAARLLQAAPRESDILDGAADEEAAKVLILVDAVRCPRNRIADRIGYSVRWFYDHQARLIYADSVHWRPADVAELRRCVDDRRKSHYLEGYAGEYILPNWELYQREARLYADIEAYQGGKLNWSEPIGSAPSLFDHSFLDDLIVAMEALGFFTPEGLAAIANVWRSTYFDDDMHATTSEKLIQQTIERLISLGVPLPHAQQQHVRALYSHWQFPMYDLDFRPIPMPLEELRAMQERLGRSTYGV